MELERNHKNLLNKHKCVGIRYEIREHLIGKIHPRYKNEFIHNQTTVNWAQLSNEYRANVSGDFEDSGDSGESGASGESGTSGESGESDDSGDSGESDDSGE